MENIGEQHRERHVKKNRGKHGESSRKESEKKPGKARRGLASLCGILGMLLLVALVAVCLPLTVPRLFGWHIYSVISGSMEPAIPTGSLVYIREMGPEEVAEGDIIAYYGAWDSASIITHRVVENRVFMGEFVTKGDANQDEDMNPIPYASFIGRVEHSFPGLGNAAQALTSTAGKMTAGCVIAVALLLQGLASVLKK